MNTCSPVCGTFWEEYEVVLLCLMTYVTEGEILDLKRPMIFPVSSLTTSWVWRCDLLTFLLTRLCYAITNSIPMESLAELIPFSVSCLAHRVLSSKNKGINSIYLVNMKSADQNSANTVSLVNHSMCLQGILCSWIHRLATVEWHNFLFII